MNNLESLELSLALAESFTGGYVANQITNKPGASKYFKGGIVCYSKSSKQNILKISPKILNKHGVVSEETAQAMAKNVINIFDADLGISFTGNAGPGVLENKPKGLIYIGLYNSKNKKNKTIKLILSDKTRSQIKKIAFLTAIENLRFVL